MTDFSWWVIDGLAVGAPGISMACRVATARGHRCAMADRHWRPDGSTVLLSYYWTEQLGEIVRSLRERALGPGAASVLVGGQSAMANPQSLSPWCSHVYLGAAELWDGTLEHPQVLDLSSKPSEPCAAVYPDVLSVQITEGVTMKQKRSGLQLTRGCKRRCLFCQYAWIVPTAEVPLEDALVAIRYRGTKALRLIGTDRGSYSGWATVAEAMRENDAVHTTGDISVREILGNPSVVDELTLLRMGIEGCSARLRAMVGKPITDDELVEAIGIAWRAGKRSITWYMIYGLPSEGADDYACLLEVLRRLGRDVMTGGTVAIAWNAFQPNAMTPMQWCASATEVADPEALRRMQRTRVHGLTVMHKPPHTSESRLVERMCYLRATAATARVTYALATEKKWRDHPEWARRAYADIEGCDPCAAWPADKPLPWDGWVMHNRARLEKIANKRGWYGKS